MKMPHHSRFLLTALLLILAVNVASAQTPEPETTPVPLRAPLVEVVDIDRARGLYRTVDYEFGIVCTGNEYAISCVEVDNAR